jgi:hypothetical protein
MVSKKRTKVKLTRSEAAKKGWKTRRKNIKVLKEIGVSLDEDFEVKRAALEQYYHIKMIVLKASLGAITVKDALLLLPEEAREESVKRIVQDRLDRSVRLFGDPRIEAWDLAEELDWDISDVYDAWDYDENAA